MRPVLHHPPRKLIWLLQRSKAYIYRWVRVNTKRAVKHDNAKYCLVIVDENDNTGYKGRECCIYFPVSIILIILASRAGKKCKFPGKKFTFPTHLPLCLMYFLMWKVIISLQMVKFPGKELPRFPTFSNPACINCPSSLPSVWWLEQCSVYQLVFNLSDLPHNKNHNIILWRAVYVL